MIHLVFSDLAAHARVWLGAFAVAIASGFVGGMAAGLVETGMAYGGEVQSGLSSAGSAVISFTAVTALIVLSSIANLTVVLQQRNYALWQLIGVRPALVGTIVLIQLAVVAVVGAAVGCAVSVPFIARLFAWSFRDWPTMRGVAVQLSGSGVLLVIAAILCVVLLGGLRGARRASRTPPIEALRASEPPKVRMGWFRYVIAAAVLAGVIGMAWSMAGATFSGVSGMAPLLTPMVAGVLAAVGPLLYPLTLHAWASIVPASASATWLLARNSARYRLSRSNAAIGPLMVAVAIAGGLYTSGATLSAAQTARTGRTEGFDLAPEGVVIMLGGPLLLSGVAAAATVFMSGQEREREFALIQAAGSTQGSIVLAALWEAVIYAATAAALGTVATIIGGLIVAHSLGLALPAVAFGTIALIALGGFLLILAATIAPTAAALRHEIPRSLSVE